MNKLKSSDALAQASDGAGEVWARINGFENYAVSDGGRVMNVKSGSMLKPIAHIRGPKVNLHRGGKQRTATIQNLLRQTFGIDNRPPKIPKLPRVTKPIEVKKTKKVKVPIQVRLTFAESFWAKVDVGRDGECWDWLGKQDKHGYGQVQRVYYKKGDRRVSYTVAHVIAHYLTKGDIPGGLELDHTCHRKACCNPDHLEAVTRIENHRRAALFEQNYIFSLVAKPLRFQRQSRDRRGLKAARQRRRAEVRHWKMNQMEPRKPNAGVPLAGNPDTLSEKVPA